MLSLFLFLSRVTCFISGWVNRKVVWIGAIAICVINFIIVAYCQFVLCHCHQVVEENLGVVFFHGRWVSKVLCACIGLVRAFEFCKMQRCRWNQFVLPNLANSAASQTRVGLWSYSMNKAEELFRKTLQELRMLSSVTINCQVTKIVMNPGCQLSVL